MARTPHQSIDLIVAKNHAITAYDRACVFDQMLGDDDRLHTTGVVFLGIGQEFKLTESNGTVTVGSGMGSIDGRQFEASATSFDLTSLTGVKYCTVYVEVDTMSVTAEKASIRIAYDSGTFPTITGEDLAQRQRGIARMQLHRFAYKATGHQVYMAERLFEGRSPGVAFRAKSMAEPGAEIRGNRLEDLLEEGTGYFAKARKADSSDDTPNLAGRSIDSLLNVGGTSGMYMLFAPIGTIELTPAKCGGHQEGDGSSCFINAGDGSLEAADPCWWDGDEWSREFSADEWQNPRVTGTSPWTILWLVELSLSTSHATGMWWWEHFEERKRMTWRGIVGNTRNPGKTTLWGTEIRIRCLDRKGGQPAIIEHHKFFQAQAQLTLTLDGTFPFKSGSRWYLPKISLKCQDAYHWHGRIKVTPLAIMPNQFDILDD